jgi:FkbM family methyltransferase
MTETYIDITDLEWVTTKIIKKHSDGPENTHPWLYELDLFRPLADWDVWSYWEKERIASMQKHIKPGEVLWEIGTEQGWMAALFSKYVTDQLVLVEPTAEFWPGIKAIFQKNKLKDPIVSFCGFADDTSQTWEQSFGWPVEVHSGKVIEKRKYRNLFDKDDLRDIPAIQLDKISANCDAISIDVEGAELHVLRGATHLLSAHRPKVWVSVHPDMMERDYGHTKADLLFFMDAQDYDAELLAVDHEHHYAFFPKEI